MKNNRKTRRRSKSTGKVGSDPEALRQVGGSGDFGAPAGDQDVRERDYVSRNTKASDRGAAQPDSFEFEGERTHGAGGKASGPGSSSGGDLDTDIIGVGTGGSGIAATPPSGRPPEADDEQKRHIPPKPAEERARPGAGKSGGMDRSLQRPSAENVEGDGAGADATGKPQEGAEDASVGEVSSDEASGENDRR